MKPVKSKPYWLRGSTKRFKAEKSNEMRNPEFQVDR